MDKELKIRVVFDTGRAKTETVEYAEGSIGALEKNLRLAKVAMKDLTSGTEAHAAALVKLKMLQAEVNDAYGRGITATKSATGASANAAMTLQALNYTVRDSPYFFRDFSLGILAVGNNLNPLIDGLKRMNDEAKASNQTFWQMAKGTLGSGGIFTLGMSLAVTAIQAVTFMMAKNKSATKDLESGFSGLVGEVDKSRETLRKLNEELQNTPPNQIPEKIGQIEEAIKNLTKEMADNNAKMNTYRETWYNSLILPISTVGLTLGKMFFDWDNNENQKKLDLLIESLGKLSMKAQDVSGIFSAFQKGTKDFSDALKGLKFDELDKLVATLGKVKGQLTPDNKPGSIDFGGIWGWGTAKQIDDLIEKINLLRNPPKGKKEKEAEPEFPFLVEKIKELKALEDQKPFAKTTEEVDKLRRAIRAVNEEINAFNNRLKAEEEISKIALKFKEDFENQFQKDLGKDLDTDKKRKEKLEDALLKKRQKALDDLAKGTLGEARENIEFIKGIATETGDALFQAFLHGKQSLDEFIVSLTVAIGRMLLMKVISLGLNSIFGGTEIMPTAVTEGTPYVPNAPGLPRGGSGGWSGSLVSPDYRSIGLQRQMQAMNMNMVSGQPTILIQTDIDGLKFTKRTINPAQAKLIRGNVISVS